MREILFRGKRVDNGEWVEGGSIINAQDGSIWIIPTNGIIQYVADSRKLVHVEAIPVVPETVCEYTGLTDKNGKRIFEGDICGCFCNTQIFEVKYCEERCGYFFDDCVKSGGCEPAPECLGNLRNTIEVIGNIHDNPELLEEDKQ